MSHISIPVLRRFLQQYQAGIPQLSELSTLLSSLTEQPEETQRQGLVELYHRVYPLLEHELWNGDEFELTLDETTIHILNLEEVRRLWR